MLQSQRGRTQDGIMHIADWAATLAAIVGVDPTANEPHPVVGVGAFVHTLG